MSHETLTEEKPEWISLEQAAAILRKKPSTTYQYIKGGVWVNKIRYRDNVVTRRKEFKRLDCERLIKSLDKLANKKIAD